jgi:glucose-1-phosphate adenylyltransferase
MKHQTTNLDCSYRMDYMKFVDHHRANNADITIGCLPMDESRASDFGLMKIDGSGQIVEFAEKPKGAALENMKVDLKVLGVDAAKAARNQYMASMGIYVFKKNALVEMLRSGDKMNDFGGEIIPQAAKTKKVMAYLFDDYWEDIGTIESFFHANLALTKNVSSTAAFWCFLFPFVSQSHVFTLLCLSFLAQAIYIVPLFTSILSN